MAARSIFVGSFAKRSGTGTQDITGLGFQPKAILFWSVARSSQDGFESADQRQIFGVSDGSHHASVSHVVQNGGVFDAAHGHRNDAALIIVDLDDSLNSSGVVSALGADGFTIDWTTAAGHADILINFLAIGGTAVSVFVGDVSTNTSTGSQSVAGVGFQPDCVIFLPFSRSSSATSASGGFGPSGVGWMTSSNQGASSTDTVSSARLRYQRTDRCIALRGASATFEQEAEAVSLDADGFTINWLTAHAGRLSYLALKGLDVFAGSVVEPTVDGAASISTAGTNPLAILLMGVGNGPSTSTNNGDEFGFGAADAAGHHRVTWSADRVGAHVTARYQSAAAAYISANAAHGSVMTLQSLITVSVLSQSLTLSFTIPDVSPDPNGGDQVLYLIFGEPETTTPSEPEFTDGEYSQPISEITLHLDSGVFPRAEVDLNDRAIYQHGYKPGSVLEWQRATRGLSDKAGQLEHLSYGATFSDIDRFFRGLLDDEDSRYLPNRPAPLWQIDDEDRRQELPWRLSANGFISSYSPDPDLKFSITCVDWLRKKFTRQRRSQLSWQPLVRTEDFDINTTPAQVQNKPAPFPYNPDRDDDLQNVADTVRTTGYLPDPTAGAPTLTGSPANPVTKRFYFTAMNGFYGDPALQRISDHRGETYYASVDQSVPDDQELRDQVNSGTASVYCDFPITADAATSEVRVYAGDTNGANIKYLGLATNLGGGSFNYTYGKSPLSGGPLYTPGDDARPPARNNTYLPGTLSGGNVTTDTGSGMVALIYTGLRLCLDGIHRCEFLYAGCAVKPNFAVYVGGVRVPDSELDAYYAVPGRATWTAAFDSRQYFEIFGRRYTTICVDRAYATANGLVAADQLSAGDTPLTVNGDGIEDVGDATGDEITNLFLQALHFAENAGPPDRPINSASWLGASPLEFTHIPGLPYVDRTSFQALAAAYPEFDGDGVGGVIGAGQEDIGFADVMARFCLSGDFQIGFNRKGQLIASREPNDIPAATIAIDDVINITASSFRISDGVLSDFFNILPFRYGRDLSGRTSGGRVFDVTRGVSLNLPTGDGWQSTANGDTEVEDTASQYHFDQTIAAPQMDLHFLSDRTLALQVVNRVLRRYSFPFRRVSLTLPLSGTSIDLGDVFEVTHIEGIGSSGWNHEPLRCLRHELDPNSNSVTLEAYAVSTIAGRVVTPDTFDPVTTPDGTDFVVVP